MAKFNTIGYVGVPKKDATKRYIKLNKGYTLVVKTPSGEEVTLPEGSYISMFEPKIRKGQTEEEFTEMKKWKRFDVTVITEE